MEAERKSQCYRKRFNQLKNAIDEKEWRAHWLELSQYMLPRKGRFLSDDSHEEHNSGAKRNSKIINGSAHDAVRTLAAGMQGGLTSPSRPWFQLALPDKDIMEYGPVREWLDSLRTAMLHVFQRSNFYSSVNNVYEELGVFGTSTMGIFEDYETVVRFRPYTVGEYYLANGADLRVNSLYRRCTMTARQLVEMFGKENCSIHVRQAYEENNGERPFGVIHVMQPNIARDPASLGRGGMKYESVYFEESPSEDTDTFLRVSGFRSIPFVAPRWATTSTDVYGRSPGMDALGDVKMLQKMETKSLTALDKMIDPPMIAPTALMRHGNPNTLPGGVNYVDIAQGQAGFAPAYQINPNFQQMEGKVERIEQRIRRFFFNDLFMQILGQEKQMTAREVAERHDEKIMMLGPVLERLQSEMLGPIIQRTFEVMTEMGMVPPPPPEVEQMPIEIKYISLLAQAQQMVMAPGIEQFAGFVANLAGVNPDVLDKVDFDQTVDEYAGLMGVPPKIVRSDEDVKALRAQKAQAAQAQMQAEQGLQMAQGAKTLSETKMGEGSALDVMTGGLV